MPMLMRCLWSGMLIPALLTTIAARGDEPLRICLVSGSAEYESDSSLTAFQAYLDARYPVQTTLLKAQGFETLPGVEALDDCDVALFFTRRLTIDGQALATVKRYCESGKPIVAVRTASHGFQNYLEFDHQVLGGHYQGHFGNGPEQVVTVLPEQAEHPLLRGVANTLRSKYSLYKTAPLADDAQLLMTGETTESGGSQPVSWIREHAGGRVFYTALGGLADFENDDFRQLLVNALYWTAHREPPVAPSSSE
jgi:type 1 glutamine amidotransferase